MAKSVLLGGERKGRTGLSCVEDWQRASPDKCAASGPLCLTTGGASRSARAVMGDGGSRSWRPHLSHQGPSGFLIERRSAPPNAAAPMRLGRSAAGLETSRGDRLPRRGRQHGPSWTYASQPQTPPEVPLQQHHHRRATVTPTRLREECWRLLLSGRSARLKAGVALEAGVICIRLRFVFFRFMCQIHKA